MAGNGRRARAGVESVWHRQRAAVLVGGAGRVAFSSMAAPSGQDHGHLTGPRRYLRETIPASPTAVRDAERTRARLLNQVDEGRNRRTRATVNQLMDRYLGLLGVDATTLKSYEATSETTSGRCWVSCRFEQAGRRDPRLVLRHPADLPRPLRRFQDRGAPHMHAITTPPGWRVAIEISLRTAAELAEDEQVTQKLDVVPVGGQVTVDFTAGSRSPEPRWSTTPTTSSSVTTCSPRPAWTTPSTSPSPTRAA